MQEVEGRLKKDVGEVPSKFGRKENDGGGILEKSKTKRVYRKKKQESRKISSSKARSFEKGSSRLKDYQHMALPRCKKVKQGVREKIG